MRNLHQGHDRCRHHLFSLAKVFFPLMPTDSSDVETMWLVVESFLVALQKAVHDFDLETFERLMKELERAYTVLLHTMKVEV